MYLKSFKAFLTDNNLKCLNFVIKKSTKFGLTYYTFFDENGKDQHVGFSDYTKVMLDELSAIDNYIKEQCKKELLHMKMEDTFNEKK